MQRYISWINNNRYPNIIILFSNTTWIIALINLLKWNTSFVVVLSWFYRYYMHCCSSCVMLMFEGFQYYHMVRVKKNKSWHHLAFDKKEKLLGNLLIKVKKIKTTIEKRVSKGLGYNMCNKNNIGQGIKELSINRIFIWFQTEIRFSNGNLSFIF